MQLTPSPFAPKKVIILPAVPGMEVATHSVGLYNSPRDDLAVIRFAPGTQAGGATTQSQTASDDVKWCRKCLATGNEARALIVNAGNSNAFTGEKGRQKNAATRQVVRDIIGCKEDEIYLSATGVIGEALPISLIADAVKETAPKLGSASCLDVAKAIMTTDTYPKLGSKSVDIDGQKVQLCGVAKGSGMIAPNMATMLVYLFTDARLPKTVCQALVNETIDETFNSITVDSDTSTSDTLLFFATGQTDHKEISDIDAPCLNTFKAAFHELMLDLALQVVKDGEGISKFISIKVKGANDNHSARKIALSIANSPLVKTAIAGEDANWGRVVMAAGKSGEAMNVDNMSIAFGGIITAEKGAMANNYDEADVTAHLKQNEINIDIDVGLEAAGQAEVWTSDLTHAYIDINADYRS